jgi:hypothetical protein
MSSEFSPYLIKDSRIADIKDSVAYGVYSGASQNTYQTFNATSTSTSQISFNVNVPSENTILDRNLLIGATYDFTYTTTGATVKDDIVMKYGLNDAFQAFPLNQSIVSMNATINNTSISINSQDVLPILLKLIPQRELQKYQGLTPCLIDTFGFDLNGSYYSENIGANGVSENVNPLGSIHTAGQEGVILPRGSFPLKSIAITNPTTANSLKVGTANDVISVRMTAEFVEPLFISPFIFGGKYDNGQGLVGINTLNLNLNIDTTLKRFWSHAVGVSPSYPGTYSLTLNAITNARLMVNFLTSQPTDLIKAKNVVPFMDYPRYITGVANSQQLTKNGGNNPSIPTQNIQLNQIPDLILVALRKPVANQSGLDPSTFYPITGVSVNFNNASGLLSSATQHQLYEMSRDNGVQQSWLEWSGKVNSYTSANDAPALTDVNVLFRLSAGSILVINPAKDLSLPAYLSNGSIGQFNLQLNVSAINYSSVDITPEIVIICCNSGVFTTIAGSSSIYTGLLTKQMVLDVASQQQAISSLNNSRLVGGALSDMISTNMRDIPIVKSAIEKANGRGGAMSAGRKLDSFVM